MAVKISTETEPWKMAVNTVADMWAAYHFVDPLVTAEQPEIAAAMVKIWSMMKKNPIRDGISRRERVRKMQLDAAPSKM